MPFWGDLLSAECVNHNFYALFTLQACVQRHKLARKEENEGLAVHFRIIAVVIFSILMIPLMRHQTNPDRERERKTLLILTGLVGSLMIVLGILRRLNC
jgi:hypothetical protein